MVLYKCFVFAGEWPVGPLLCMLGLQCSLIDKAYRAYLPNVLLYLEPSQNNKIYRPPRPGADPGFEKAGGSGASFWAYLGQFSGLFKLNWRKNGIRACLP